jgi:hypothetical protein
MNLNEYDFIRVQRGARIFFFNDDIGFQHSYSGAGFTSGVTSGGDLVEVSGISSLPLGFYKVYDLGRYVGDLYIDPDPVCTAICQT